MMEVFGWVSGICFCLCYIPQIVRTHRLKTVDDISLWLWILSALAYISGTVYGAYLDKLPLLFNYVVGLGLNCTIIMQWVLYRDPRKDIVREEVNAVLKQIRKKANE